MRFFVYILDNILEISCDSENNHIWVISCRSFDRWLCCDSKTKVISRTWENLWLIWAIKNMRSCIIIYFSIESCCLYEARIAWIISCNYWRNKLITISNFISCKRVYKYCWIWCTLKTTIGRLCCDRCAINSIGTKLNIDRSCRCGCTRKSTEIDGTTSRNDKIKNRKNTSLYLKTIDDTSRCTWKKIVPHDICRESTTTDNGTGTDICRCEWWCCSDHHSGCDDSWKEFFWNRMHICIG